MEGPRRCGDAAPPRSRAGPRRCARGRAKDGAPDDDAARDRDEVRRRKELRGPPERPRQRREREDVARQHDRRQQEHLGELNRLHLRPRPRGDEEPERQEREEVDRSRARAAAAGCRGSARGRPRSSDSRMKSSCTNASTRYGSSLPSTTATGEAGVTMSCSSVPRSRSRTMANAASSVPEKVRRIATRPGDQQVRAARVRIEEKERMRADGKILRAGPLRQLRERLREGDAVGGGQGLARDGRVRAVDQHEEVGRLAVQAAPRVVGRDLDADRGAAGDDVLAQRGARGRIGHDVEVARVDEVVQELAGSAASGSGRRRRCGRA